MRASRMGFPNPDKSPPEVLVQRASASVRSRTYSWTVSYPAAMRTSSRYRSAPARQALTPTLRVDRDATDMGPSRDRTVIDARLGCEAADHWFIAVDTENCRGPLLGKAGSNRVHGRFVNRRGYRLTPQARLCPCPQTGESARGGGADLAVEHPVRHLLIVRVPPARP